MFIFDISLPSNSPKSSGLPPLTEWLQPNYHGPGDLASRASSHGLHDPKNWREDFAEFEYEYPDNLELKHALNEAKNKITPIREENDRKFNTISTACNKYEDLRGRRGVLVQKYDAEIVTNAWMKMYECMSLLDDPLLSTLNKANSRSTAGKSFNSFHIAEAPGNFMVAMNHYLYSHYPKLEWNWLANSYRDLYTSSITGDPKLANSHYLQDTYGLIRAYKNRWIFGADGDGDITSPANIRTFATTVAERFGSAGLHFITSDVKFVPRDVNYDEEEWQNIPVQMGHALSSLVTLKKGGSCMLKEFTFFEAPKMSQLFLLANCFQKLYIVKPETSRPANSEVYVFGIGYKDNLSSVQIEALYNIMNYIRFMTDASPSIFKQESIPKSFVDKVHKLNTKLTEKQIPAIDRNVELFRQYEGVPFKEMCKDMSSSREKAAQEWITRYGIKELPKNRHIASS